MNTRGKLLLLTLLAFIAISFSSCLVRKSPYKKWDRKPGKMYRYNTHKANAGRRLWVHDKYRNTH